MIAVPAEATPSGKRTPSCSTKDRTGKLPSSRSTQTVSCPASDGEEGAFAGLLGKPAEAWPGDVLQREPGGCHGAQQEDLRSQDPVAAAGVVVQQPFGCEGASGAGGLWAGSARTPDQLDERAALGLPADEPQQGRHAAHHLGALDGLDCLGFTVLSKIIIHIVDTPSLPSTL